MSRRREIITRDSWEAMLERLDADDQDALRAKLLEWRGGEYCQIIEVTLDLLGRLDSESSPNPPAEG